MTPDPPHRPFFVEESSVPRGARIGGGRQANVFESTSVPPTVLRLQRRPDKGSAQRVTRQLAVPNSHWQDLHPPRRWAAWPIAGVTREGRIVGTILPRLPAAEYLPLCDAVDRAGRAFWGVLASGRWCLRAALHLAHAVHRALRLGFVPVDLSGTNVWVHRRHAWVVLLDPDSLVAETELGAPEIGTTPEVMAPEQVDGGPASRQAAYWGLAIQIVRLLMEGQHPFLGDPPGAPPRPDRQEENIRRGHSLLAGSPLLLPAAALPVEVLPPAALALARQCLVAGHRDGECRPAPHRWVELLARVDSRSRACPADPRHLADGDGCPWCEVLVARRRPIVPAYGGVA